MKRHERDNLKNRKRGDQLQKEKDHSRTELSKNVSLREKLEKLCRELQRENNRLKVRNFAGVVALYICINVRLHRSRLTLDTGREQDVTRCRKAQSRGLG